MERKHDEDDRPPENKDSAREGDKNRRQMDEIPPPGTDPLHEGP